MKLRHLLLSIPIILLMACSPNPEEANLASLPVAESETPLPTEATQAEPELEVEAEPELETNTVVVQPSGNSLDSAYFDSYVISDNGFGTEVNVTVDHNAKTRTIESNALPNHVTGEFPNEGNPNTISAQDQTWTFPTEPVFRGIPTGAIQIGVAINGVKFQPNTAERANCDNGEVYNLEAIQDTAGVGLDFNNAHVQPTGAYHYHGVSELLVEAFSTDQDLVHVAFAADGHMIYYSKSRAYSPSYRLGSDDRTGINCTYTTRGGEGTTTIFGPTKDGSVHSDWDYDASYGDLDECNGITVNGEYIYLITHDYPYVSRCLMGEFTEDRPGGGGQPGGNQEGRPQGGEGQPPQGAEGEQGGRQQGGQGGGPDIAAAAETLGISEDALREALGGRRPDFEAASAALGISVEELQDALGGPPPQP